MSDTQKTNLRRTLALGLVLVLAASSLVLAKDPFRDADREQPGRSPAAELPLPEGLEGGSLPTAVSADWWSQVQRSIRLEEYAVVAGNSARADYEAANPAHRFEARFDARGLRLAPTEGATWEWGLSLTAWGRPGALEAADDAWLSADGSRVELDRRRLTEWFVNSSDGLEHGFTVPVPPQDDGDRLVFDLALAGGLRPVFAEDGQAIDFFSNGNVSVLRYAKLAVTDAAGTVVPAWMEPIAGGIRIVVEDSRAVYPIIVDPLATSAAWTAAGEATDDRFGYSVATAGDVNGDGYADVVVGAYGNTASTGKAYLYLGGASGLSASAAWTAAGEAAGDHFGYSVATAGDVNGDGYGDVVVGAYGNTALTGKAYLYLGGSTGLSASAAWTAAGEATGHDFGYSVATAGDVNGDGYADVVVGAIVAARNGVAYLYLGGPTGLSASAAWTATGEAEFDEFGWSVATAGDVNGDGYADVVVGARSNTASTGKAYLYLGGPSGLSASPAWTAAGEAVGDRFGRSVATAGDVNGDGYADVVVGAPSSNSFTGKAYLYLGGPSGLSASAAWSAAGEAVGDRFGRSVATAGDVNGDGYADVVVGAPSSNSSTGKAYLYLGGPTGLSASAAWTAAGEAASDQFGASVATAGDVNGDGYADVVVGAEGNSDNTGKAYLYLGGAGVLSASAAWSAAGEAAGDSFGISVATAGDVNGDGYADVVVGASTSNSFTGKAYLYLGGPSGLSASAAWSAAGEAASDRFGFSVATAGDVNGDGYAEVVVGAHGNSGNTGKAYLYLGGPSGLSASAAWTAAGEAAGDSFGISVATAGDVNGDGYAEVVVGAHGNSGNTGKAYLYLGGPSGLSASAAWTATGEAAGDRFGYSVVTAGDVNGDGYADVIVGAAGLILTDTGKAYLYLGGPSGLSASAAWTAAGEAAGEGFGISVATAGDVNGDGYADVVVGASTSNSFTGKAYLYLGGPSGLSASAAWSAAGEAAGDSFGFSVATAGDVNGDGYADVVVGAQGNSGNTGKAYLYLGGAIGLSASAAWTAAGEAAGDSFGISVATAGDVNGDGYADVVVGADGNSGDTGKAYLYLGGGGAGVPLLPRQLRTDLSALISLGGPAFEQQFRLGLTLRSPVGRVWRKLEWQVAPWGGVFAPAVNPIQSDSDWYANPVARTVPVTLPEDLQRYVWRARIKYHPAQSPFLLWSPWITLTGNGLHETDVFSTSQVAPPPCSAPDEELYITTMTIDGNGKPVIHYQDPNQPADVTGYNVYRAAAPMGPWVLLGSNVVDMDEGTPNIQYVDQTGDVGGPWFYEVAAWNDACGLEGPY